MKDTLLYPPQKKNRKVPPYFPIRNSQKSTLINLFNQFINLTRRKDMRKISLKELFYLKSL